MKRTVALILALILCCAALPAFAAGNVRLTEETASYVLSHSDGYRVYYYAVVRNEGDARASVNDLLFEIRDRDDEAIESTTKYTLYPQILEPGQAGWLVVTKDVKDYALMVGVPARQIGWVCECGKRLGDDLKCECGRNFILGNGKLIKI